jgi:hypothetical protein
VKTITSKDIRNGFKWCDWCKEKTLAKYKWYGSKACEEHKEKLIPDDRMTEADYQSWYRF